MLIAPGAMTLYRPHQITRAALRSCRGHFVSAALFSALVNALYIVPTVYMLQVYDRVVPTRGLQTLLFLTIILIWALATLALLDRARIRLAVRAGVHMDAALAPLILDAALGSADQPAARQGLRDFDALRAALSGPAMIALFDAPWVPIYLLVCFLVHPWVGVLAIAGCIILPLIALATERSVKDGVEEAQRAAASAYAHQDALLNSADAIRALGMRRQLVARQLRQREAMLLAQTQASFSASGFLTVGKFIRLLLQSLALGLGALLAIDNLISAGAIFAASFLVSRALQPIEQLIGSWKTLVQARQGLRNLDTLLAAGPAGHAITALPAPKGSIVLENVTLLNDTRDGAVLQNMSLTIAPGEVVAIVGPSGAGKSSLIRTIVGALTPDRGSVRFDGADARDWDSAYLARHIGYLPQDSALLAGSIADNIARFTGELDDDDKSDRDAAVVAAAQKAGADALIRRLRDGYGHQLKMGGKGISAGQAQRIALARALYGDPPILILDEPNSHLDSEGDAALIATLTALKAEGKTILLVSHKLSIMPVVDKILVVKDGTAALFGPRDEVMAKIAPTRTRPANLTIARTAP